MNKYKRILLKLSGETLVGKEGFGIDQEACLLLANSIKAIRETGVQLGIVIGGGNIFRGINLKNLGMERNAADQMGMLATLMNGIALQKSLEKVGCPAVLMSALECPKVAENYTSRNAKKYLLYQVVIFVGGTGNPYFTTDTAAALRAAEINADILLKATKVDGVFDKDPKKFASAKKYDTLTYSQFLAQKLEVMDATSIALCMSSNIPVFVFHMNLLQKGVLSALETHTEGTFIKGE